MRSDTGLANRVALLDLDVAIRIRRHRDTAKLRTTILDFRGFDSSRILVLRGAILVPMGDFLEVLSRRVFAGIVLVGRLSVLAHLGCEGDPCSRRWRPAPRFLSPRFRIEAIRTLQDCC